MEERTKKEITGEKIKKLILNVILVLIISVFGIGGFLLGFFIEGTSMKEDEIEICKSIIYQIQDNKKIYIPEDYKCTMSHDEISVTNKSRAGSVKAIIQEDIVDIEYDNSLTERIITGIVLALFLSFLSLVVICVIYPYQR